MSANKDTTICRQDAIDLLAERHCDICPYNDHRHNSQRCNECDYRESMDDLEDVPAVQPETHDKRTETHACDYISRQAAINAVENTDCELSSNAWDEITDAIMQVPSAQPDLAQLLAYECGKASAQPEIKPIGYNDCSNAMMKMWMDNVVTDGEYNRIMDKLNAYWRAKDE